MVEEHFEQLRKRVMSCKRCDLSRTRINPVFGEGSENADIMFIGEAPGSNEDKQGRPQSAGFRVYSEREPATFAVECLPGVSPPSGRLVQREPRLPRR